MRTMLVVGLLSLSAILAPSRPVLAHCQVPCGIFSDHARVEQLREDLTTIRKAVTELAALAGKRDVQSQQQFVRWVMTKEQHAERAMRTVADYFLAQKVKLPPPGDKKAQADYVERLARHHAVLVAAMKTKQSSAQAEVTALGKAIDGIAGYWPPGK